MSWSALHRWLAIVLVAFLVVWSVTGVMFHLKPGWDRAYDTLSIDRGKTETLETALGPLTRINGALAAPLTDEQARVLVADALSRSAHAAAYGALVRTVSDERAVTFEHANAAIRIDRGSGRVSQQGGDTRRIDWLYRIHYLQWTGSKTVDRVLAVAGLGLIWAVMIPGVVLFVRRVRRRP